MAEEAKRARLVEAIAVYKGVLAARNRAEVGRRHLVLNEGPSLRDPAVLTGARSIASLPCAPFLRKKL